jgi:2-hydroxychromene-2-carboxylate isomerase
MTIAYDLFWSFRSPYSYLAVPRLIELERDYDVRATVRPVYPIAVRIDGFFKNANPMWLPYLVRDVARMAEMLGMPFAPPNPDPIEMDNKTA